MSVTPNMLVTKFSGVTDSELRLGLFDSCKAKHLNVTLVTVVYTPQAFGTDVNSGTCKSRLEQQVM